MIESTQNEKPGSAQTSAAPDADPASSGTTADTADASADATEPAAKDAQPKVAFGGLTPSEAAKKRWREKRAREQDEDQAQAAFARSEVALVRVTVETGQVIDRLAKDAKNGNTQAARELREWLARVEVETDTSVSALDRGTRQRMKARLLQEMAQDEQPQRPSVPSSDGADGHVGSGAIGLGAEGEAHPAAAGTPVDAVPGGSTSARDSATGMSEAPHPQDS